MNAVDLQLDYFQIYDLEPVVDLRRRSVATRTVELQGQFDKAHEKARLECLDKFADRVSKNKEKLYDKNAHLTWYSLYYPTPENATRYVTVADQFTKEQVLRIKGVIGLLVPARKRMGQQRVFSKETNLDHYKVYGVIEGQPVDQGPVALEDQFFTREAKVYKPFAFAVPVWKMHGEKEFKVLHEQAHLTIYVVEKSKELLTKIDTRDQFFTLNGVTLKWSYLLAVPTWKRDWREG